MNLVIDSIDGHSPLPDNVYIDKSPIHGMGIFAKVDIPAGYDFGITHVVDKRFSDGFMRTPMGGFMNHSDTPNTKTYEKDDVVITQAISDIRKDEELTVDYRPWYKEEVLASYK